LNVNSLNVYVHALAFLEEDAVRFGEKCMHYEVGVRPRDRPKKTSEVLFKKLSHQTSMQGKCCGL